MQTSLRRARSKVIDPKTDIHISVRNLVKIYDWPGRVSRQWKSGLLIRRRLGLEKTTLYLPDCRMTVPFPCLTWDRKRSVLIPPLIMRIPLVLLRSRFRREKEDSLWNWAGSSSC